MGLLDFLSSPDYGLGLLGGLNPLPQQQPMRDFPQGYFGAADPRWNNPKYGIDTKKTTEDFIKALKNGDPYNGSGMMPAPQSPWDQPGITYSPSVLQPQAAPSPFDTRTVNAPIFGTPQQIAAANVQAPPQASQAAPQAAPDSTGFFAPPSGAQAPLQPPAATDFSSRNAGPQPAPQMPPQAAPESPVAPSGGNGMAALMNFLTAPGGLAGSIAGAIGGAQTGQRLDAVGQQQQIYRALVNNGASPNDAMAAAVSPELFRQIAPQYFSKGQPIETGTDPLTGQKNFAVYDAHSHSFIPINFAGGGQSPGMGGLADRLAAMRSQGATTEQMLSQIPNGYRDDVKAMGEGRSLPANLGRAATRGPLLTLTKMVYPDFDETRIPTRVAMRKDFSGEGKNGQAIGALNTVQHHADMVSDAMERFYKAGGGSNMPLKNAIMLALSQQAGINPELRDAAQHLQDTLNATEHEVTSAYNSGHITDADRNSWKSIDPLSMPISQARQKLADYVDLLNGKRDSLNHIYKTEFHEDAPTIDKATNEAVTKKVHSRLEGGGDKAEAAPSPLKVGQSVKVGNVTIKKVKD